MKKTFTRKYSLWGILVALATMYLPQAAQAQCSCFTSVNVSMSSGCSFTVLPQMISGCDTGVVWVADENPLDSNIITTPGSYMYALRDSVGNVLCMGTIQAEDKSAPLLQYYLAPCTGNITASLAAFQTATFMSTDILQIYNEDRSWQDTTYDYFSGTPVFSDGCLIANGCYTELKINDQITYYSCTDAPWLADRIFARIDRTFFATDCMGNRTTVTQQIYFKTPALSPGLANAINTAFSNKTVVLNGGGCSLTAEQMMAQFKTSTYPDTFNGVAQPMLIFQDPYHCSPTTELYGIFQEAVANGVAKKYLNQRMSFSLRLIFDDGNCTEGRRIMVQILGIDWCTGTVYTLADNVLLRLGAVNTSANLVASTQNITASAQGGVYPLGVLSNTAWSIDDDMYWASVSPTSGYNNGTVQVTVQPNNSSFLRSGRIFINAPGLGTQTVILTQAASVLEFLNATPSAINFGSTAGTATVQVQSSGSWTVSDNASWLTLNVSQGYGNANLSASATANTSGAARSATIIFTMGSLSTSVNVYQEATSALLTFSPSSFAFPASGGSSNLSIQSNTNWVLSSKPAWITLNSSSGTNNSTLIVTCAVNTAEISRNGSITFLCNGTQLKTIQVTQEGRPAGVTLTPASLSFDQAGGQASLQVGASGTWTASSSAAWLSFPNGNTGNQSGGLTLAATPNSGSSLRTAIVQVADPAGHLATATITQNGISPTFQTGVDTIYFGSEGGFDTLHIVSNTSWALSEYLQWLGLSAIRGRNSADIIISCVPNTTDQVRTGQILLYGSGFQAQYIRVIQAPRASLLSVSPAQLRFNGNGGSTPVSVSSNTGWYTASSAPWIQVNPTSGVADGVVQISCINSNDSTARSGQVTFYASGASPVTVRVTQDAAGVALFTRTDTMRFNSAGGLDSLYIWANTGWKASVTQPWVLLSQTAGDKPARLFFTVLPNTGAGTRTAELEVIGNDGSKSKLLLIQTGIQPVLSALLDVRAFSPSGGSAILQIQSNLQWSISGHTDWLELSARQGIGNQTITVLCAPNGGSSGRNTTLVISAPGADTIRLSILQEADRPYLLVNETIVDLPAEGGEFPLVLLSNISWRTSELISWLQVSPISGTGSDTLILKVLPRSGSNQRSGTLTIYGTGVPSLRVTIRQAGLPINAPGLFQPGIIKIDEEIQAPKFSVFPNPASDLISLRITERLTEPCTLVVHDVQGRVMNWQSFPRGLEPATQLSIPVADYPEGIYTITLKGKFLHYVEKIQVSRTK